MYSGGRTDGWWEEEREEEAALASAYDSWRLVMQCRCTAAAGNKTIVASLCAEKPGSFQNRCIYSIVPMSVPHQRMPTDENTENSFSRCQQVRPRLKEGVVTIRRVDRCCKGYRASRQRMRVFNREMAADSEESPVAGGGRS
jgi:hypothetical protein